MPAQRFRVPHTLVLLFGMVVVAYLLTLVLPAGSYERVPTDHGRDQVVAGSYAPIAEAPELPVWEVLTAIPRGFTAAEEIIFFVFIVGGAFGVFRATGAVDAGIGVLLERLQNVPWLLVAGGMLVFAAGSSTLGMAEEYLPFVPVLVALAVGLGFDAMTAVGILCVGYGVGYGTAVINPFTVLIAQEIAGVPPASGMGYRLILAVVFFAVGFHHVLAYARRVQRDPAASYLAGLGPGGLAPAAAGHAAGHAAGPAPGAPAATEAPEASEASEVAAAAPLASHPPLTRTHLAVLAATFVVIVFLVVGIKLWGWYLIEMGAAFLGLAVLLGLVGRLGFDRTAREFCTGAADLTTTALLIGFARAIQVVLEDGQVVDTIIHGVAQPLASLGAAGAAVGMMVVQSLTNFFIPSGSGQAYVTMPLMAPLADLVGVSRQVAVLAYQFGDGFTNILVPTNAVLVGILAMAGVPYDRWLRFIVPFMIKVWLVGALALAIAVWIGY